LEAAREAQLVKAAKGGDRRAFGDLVAHFQDRLFRAACGLVRNATEAEDIAQETFVRAYLGLGRFRGDSAFYTWLFGILLNVYRRFLRRSRRDRTVEMADVERADGAPSPSRRAAVGEELGRTLRAIEHLPRRLREVMVLRHVEEMSYEEIAEAAGCRVGTVRSRLHRARELLVTRLGRTRVEAANAQPEASANCEVPS
jgi:RNA polymerase sigma-70 factor (ECF subfamily)